VADLSSRLLSRNGTQGAYEAKARTRVGEDRTLRIAFLQAELPPVGAGGVSYQVDLLARTMVERGHRVTAFTVAPMPGARLYETVVLSQTSIGPLKPVLGTGLAFHTIDFAGFDVVHAHGDAWAISGVPWVRTFHGTALQEAISATSILRRGSQILHYGLELISSLRAPVTTAVSRNTRHFMPGIDLVVPCAVDRVYQVMPTNDRFDEPTILLVAGLLGGRKRGHLVLSAFQDVRKRLPNSRLIVVTRDTVDQPGIITLSNLPAQDLADLFQRSWVLCSASSYEGFGLPMAEALASGLPVVSTPNPGAREVLRGGELGRIVRPESLAEALLEILEDDNLATDLRNQGREAAKIYELDNVCSQYEAAYVRAIELSGNHN
jgi:phosphatidylinositol alpha-mannosyltransferase